MELWLDSAQLDDVDWAIDSGFISGITTNPALVAKAGVVTEAEYLVHLDKIFDKVRRGPGGWPISVEVLRDDPEKILESGIKMSDYFGIEEEVLPVIKIPLSHKGRCYTPEISGLAGRDLWVNATCMFTFDQMLMAALAGADYVSIFWCRACDYAREQEDVFAEPYTQVRELRRILDRDESSSRIIAGSIRTPQNVYEAAMAGAHIVTTSRKVYEEMAQHPKTDEAVDQFLKPYKES